MELKGKVALVTGGNGGLGSRICHALARAGCDVAVIYARSREPAEVVAGELRQLGVQSEAIGCDVTDPAAVQTLMGEVARRFGRIDILINDAAYNKWIPYPDLDALTFEEWQKILSTNLTGPMLCIKAVAPIMRSQESGRIVNISSVAGLAPTGSSIAYAVSKAGLIHLTKCMAVAWRRTCWSTASRRVTSKARGRRRTWILRISNDPANHPCSREPPTRTTSPRRWWSYVAPTASRGRRWRSMLGGCFIDRESQRQIALDCSLLGLSQRLPRTGRVVALGEPLRISPSQEPGRYPSD